MYTTAQEAREAAAHTIAQWGYENVRFVIVESKLTEKARKTWFNFRQLLRSEVFNGEWHQLADGSWCRMVDTDKGAAFELGRKAFADGKRCIPIHDEAMHEMLKTMSGPVGDGDGFKAMVSLCDEWMRGWTLENLAEP